MAKIKKLAFWVCIVAIVLLVFDLVTPIFSKLFSGDQSDLTRTLANTMIYFLLPALFLGQALQVAERRPRAAGYAQMLLGFIGAFFWTIAFHTLLVVGEENNADLMNGLLMMGSASIAGILTIASGLLFVIGAGKRPVYQPRV